MKHNVRITLIILVMFVMAQFIGLYVVNYYSPTKIIHGEKINVTSPMLPYGLESPEIKNQQDFFYFLPSIILAFFLAVTIFFFLTKLKAEMVIKIWFLLVVTLALGISINSIIPRTPFASKIILATIIAFPLALIKIYGKEVFIHNLTELLIYPGIAAVFIPILNFWTIIILLILISIYDIWAVWHSGIMQKMAIYHVEKLNIFPGFMIPYFSDKVRAKIKKIKQLPKSKRKNQKVKVNIAMLGGGDVVFPIITSGVFMRAFGIVPALFVIGGATAGLTYLFFFSEKKKFYPAMPFITAGIFVGLFLWRLSVLL